MACEDNITFKGKSFKNEYEINTKKTYMEWSNESDSPSSFHGSLVVTVFTGVINNSLFA